ncbi:hypothetical protein EVB55_158 [Rhizobium phage RHph_Y68]|uniref:Uncharacterized protein n=1 Tax=Rhizobium phage RHph_Y68 TaxID=2509787 RepID=A0A7S5UUG6_9CAUD|nr:hypothetical protein PP934_gp158 [Rhizobium phage RHph_Y68]QIG68093.1 hypothetical protein EVB55_158 [Rhizobium phage RHph_Y68]
MDNTQEEQEIQNRISTLLSESFAISRFSDPLSVDQVKRNCDEISGLMIYIMKKTAEKAARDSTSSFIDFGR